MSARPFFVAAVRQQFSTNESGRKVDMLLFSGSYFHHSEIMLQLVFNCKEACQATIKVYLQIFERLRAK